MRAGSVTAPPQLEVVAAGLAAALPASVELPAGAGKTHLLAEITRQIVGADGRVIVLTHTNAGVQAIQTRLKKFELTSGVRVATLTSFAFLLARAYPVIGQFKVPGCRTGQTPPRTSPQQNGSHDPRTSKGAGTVVHTLARRRVPRLQPRSAHLRIRTC